MPLASQVLTLIKENLPTDSKTRVSIAVLGFTCACVVYKLVKPSKKAGLRVFKITGNNVVEVLEEAQRQVCSMVS